MQFRILLHFGTYRPSLAYKRGLSCSTVGLGEPDPKSLYFILKSWFVKPKMLTRVNFIFVFIFLLLLFLSLGVLTLSERFFLGCRQLRLGPQKVFYYGMLQIIFDGLKLIKTELLLVYKSDYFFFMFSPVLGFFLVILIYFFLTFVFVTNNWVWSFLFFFLQIGFFVLVRILGSFFSKSKYSFLGSLRTAVSMLSLDIVLIPFVYFLVLIKKDFFFDNILLLNLVFIIILFILRLIETSRTPFDFSEGERELVSGFNTEYGRLFFVLFFLSEYGGLLFYVIIFNFVFLNINFLLGFFYFYVYVFLRSVLLRFRYDFLMVLCWFILFPLVFIILFLIIFLAS